MTIGKPTIRSAEDGDCAWPSSCFVTRFWPPPIYILLFRCASEVKGSSQFVGSACVCRVSTATAPAVTSPLFQRGGYEASYDRTESDRSIIVVMQESITDTPHRYHPALFLGPSFFLRSPILSWFLTVVVMHFTSMPSSHRTRSRLCRSFGCVRSASDQQLGSFCQCQRGTQPIAFSSAYMPKTPSFVARSTVNHDCPHAAPRPTKYIQQVLHFLANGEKSIHESNDPSPVKCSSSALYHLISTTPHHSLLSSPK
jgi:hypothetical protein